MDGPRTIEEVSGSSGPPDTGSYILRRLREGLVVWLGALCLGTFAAHAQDATWTPDSLANGATRDWNLSTNWTPAAVPTGIATFGGASTTAVSSIVTTSVDTLQFNFGAPAYSFDLTAATFSITGSGILNGSSNAPTFTTSAGGLLKFSSTNATSTAGNAVIVNNSSGEVMTARL
jgi:hypothetical protein